MSFRSVIRLPKLPLESVTRSTVAGLDRGNFTQPESSGPAVALALNHTACAVMYTCEYWPGTLPVAETLVREEQPASSASSSTEAPNERRVGRGIPILRTCSVEPEIMAQVPPRRNA